MLTCWTQLITFSQNSASLSTYKMTALYTPLFQSDFFKYHWDDLCLLLRLRWKNIKEVIIPVLFKLEIYSFSINVRWQPLFKIIHILWLFTSFLHEIPKRETVLKRKEKANPFLSISRFHLKEEEGNAPCKWSLRFWVLLP